MTAAVIERVIDDRNSPPPDVEAQPRLHRFVGNVAECVIEEMRKDVGEHDKAGSKPDLPHANAAQQYRKRGISIHARRADVNERGCLWLSRWTII